jgi:hypothetical protein
MEDTTCPTCGKELNTVQGKRQHHTKVHDKPLPNRTCADCGDNFYDEKAQLKFCEDCKSREGRKNPNYKNAKETTSCDECGIEFEYYPSDKKGIYCSECQRDKVTENNLELYPSGENHPEWKGGKKELECAECNSKFGRRPARIQDSIRNFCGEKCMIDWMRREDNVEVRALFGFDGEDEDSIEKWIRVRRSVLERDGYSCQICNNDKNHINHVHHLIPRHKFEIDEEAHYNENGITLCSTCHTEVESGSLDIPNEVIEEKGLEKPAYQDYLRRTD